MEVFTKEEALRQRSVLLKRVKSGAVFIYPTDTIYGIGCDASDDAAVKRVREIKGRDAKPFSVIVPSMSWITENCVVSDAAKKWLVKLPGPYTLVLRLKHSSAVSALTNSGLNSVGVRIPDHWISDFVEALCVPLVTTSVNRSGKPPVSDLERLRRFDVDFVIFEGPKICKPSMVVDLVDEEKIVRA